MQNLPLITLCTYTKFNKNVEEQNDVNCNCEKEGMISCFSITTSLGLFNTKIQISVKQSNKDVSGKSLRFFDEEIYLLR